MSMPLVEILNISGTTEAGRDVPSGARLKLADSLVLLKQSLYEAEQEGMVAGLTSAEDAITKNVPLVEDILDGRPMPSLESRGGNSNVSDFRRQNTFIADRRGKIPAETEIHIRKTVASLPFESIQEMQDRLDLLLQIIRELPTASVAKRLENYLPISVPQTRAGFLTLKHVAHKYHNGTQEEDGSAYLFGAERTLRELDDRVIERAHSSEEILEVVTAQAREEAEKRLSKLVNKNSPDLEEMRSIAAERRIEDLRREAVWAGVNRPYSRFEILANQTIQAEGLHLDADAVHTRQNEVIERARDYILTGLATKRGIARVIEMLDKDPEFRQVIAQRRRMTAEELLAVDNKTKARIARDVLNSKRIVISIEQRRVFHGQDLLDEEKRKLIDALTNDPSSLSWEEIYAIETGVPRPSEERSIFDLAKERLRRQIVAEVTEKELLEILTERIKKELLAQRSSMAVDATMRSLRIDSSQLLSNPTQVLEQAEVIAARAIQLLHLDSPPITLPDIQLQGLALNEGLELLEIDQLKCVTEQNIADLLDHLAENPDRYGVEIQEREGVRVYMIDQKTRETLTRVSRLLADLSKIKDTLILPQTENEMSCLLTMVVDAITTDEPITIVTPICPAWSRDSDETYDFKSLGGDESFIAAKFFTYGKGMIAVLAKHQIPYRGILLFADWGLETEINAKDTYGRKLSQEDVQMCFQSTVAATDEHLSALQADKKVGHLFKNYTIVSMKDFLEKRMNVAEVERKMRHFFTTDRRGRKLLEELDTQSYELNRVRLGYNRTQNREFALQNLVEYSAVGQSIGPHSILAVCESRTTSRSYNMPRQKHENVPVFYVKGEGGADEGVNIL